MKKILLLMCAFICSFQIYSQSDLSVIYSPFLSSELNVEGLKKVYVLNSGEPKTVMLKGVLKFKQNVLEANFQHTVTLSSGMNEVELPSLNLWHYRHSSLKDLITLHGSFPSGDYEFCINIHSGMDKNEVLDFNLLNCHYGHHEPIFLIQLMDPPDDSYLNHEWPTLIWMANHTLGGQLQYDLKVVELRNKQTPQVAINRNSAHYSEEKIFNTLAPYPPSARSLDQEKVYAWQVYAFFRDIYMGKSEVWTFKFLNEEAIDPTLLSIPYLDIKKEKLTSEYDVYGVLKLKYNLSSSLKDELLIEVLNTKDNKVLQMNPKIDKGDNFIEYNFHQLNPLKHNRIYKLRISSTFESVYEVYFKYKNPDYL